MEMLLLVPEANGGRCFTVVRIHVVSMHVGGMGQAYSLRTMTFRCDTLTLVESRTYVRGCITENPLVRQP